MSDCCWLYRIRYKHNGSDWINLHDTSEHNAKQLARTLGKDPTVSHITVTTARIDLPSHIDWRRV